MATAERRWRLLLAVPVVLALGGAVVVATNSSDDDEPEQQPTAASEPAPVALTAESVYDFATLDQLAAGSDLVVRGTVASVARGRLVGSGDAAVTSRVVTVEVDDVLAGGAPAATVLVEEEGWLADGTPVAVNGLAPSEEGMDAVWFLDALPPGELPGYLVITHQGRYQVDGDALRGAEGRDPLVEQVERMGLRALVADI